MTSKTCIIIAGPTAVGKTSIAIQLAQHFKTAVISADSRQCYREMNIGVAKPAPELLQRVKHYFINSHSVTEDVNAGVFEQYALGAVQEIFRHSDVAVMAGGTGLYIRAFCEGMDAMPPVSNAVRDSISNQYRANGLAWLQNEIKEKDPAWFASREIQNPQRLMRALEVVTATGQSILHYQQAVKAKRDFNIIKTGLALPREQLYENINHRVNDMIDAGLPDEVEALMAYRSLNALQTVGYREMIEYFDGKTDLPVAMENIKRNTRHYAKRQLTWFAKDESIKWFSPLDYNQLITYLLHLV